MLSSKSGNVSLKLRMVTVQALGWGWGGVWILAEPLAGSVISGRFLSFLEAQGLICKMGMERSLPPRTVHRVTFINNHTMDHAEKESILGFEYHEAGPWGHHIKPLSLCWFPGPTCSSSYGRTRPAGPSGQERAWAPWLLQLWFSGPTTKTAPLQIPWALP